MQKVVFHLSLTFLLFSFSSSQTGVMEELHSNLIGTYRLLEIKSGKKTVEASKKGTYTVQITAKDEFIFLKNGKKVKTFIFRKGEVPVDIGTEQYVLFFKKNMNHVMTYSNDTITNFLFPNEFDDNIFVKESK